MSTPLCRYTAADDFKNKPFAPIVYGSNHFRLTHKNAVTGTPESVVVEWPQPFFVSSLETTNPRGTSDAAPDILYLLHLVDAEGDENAKFATALTKAIADACTPAMDVRNPIYDYDGAKTMRIEIPSKKGLLWTGVKVQRRIGGRVEEKVLTKADELMDALASGFVYAVSVSHTIAEELAVATSSNTVLWNVRSPKIVMSACAPNRVPAAYKERLIARSTPTSATEALSKYM
jgi:hypothetical protein